MTEKELERAKYLLYEETVRKLSDKNFKKEYIEHKSLRGKNTGFELDHKLSIKDGFEQNVPPSILADVANLQVVSINYNRKKSSKSIITFEELIKEITERDDMLDYD